MLTSEDVAMIKNNVSREHFDVDKLIVYLNTHEIVGNEVFEDVAIDLDGKAARLLSDLGEEYGYTPIPVEKFLRRIPFYFYYPDDKEKRATHAWLGLLVRRVQMQAGESDEEVADGLEKMYLALEDILYHFRIGVEEIFAYMGFREQKLGTGQFMDWYDYLKLCERLHWYDYMPDDFLYKYNTALEAAGRKPVTYYLEETAPGEYFYRDGGSIEIRGTFPVDPVGRPVLRWIGIKLKNAGSIRCRMKDGRTAGAIVIGLTPRTELYARNVYGDEEKWYRLYAGPLTMEFDHAILKEGRQRLKLTQKDVAEAVGATLRTYQKWETGETTPDGKFLLRLLNWLDIKDLVDATKWNKDWDDD